MHTAIRDMYISVLEKRAAEASSMSPDYGKDNQVIANGEVNTNNKDQRTQLGSLFEATKATEKATTTQVNKLLPVAKKTTGTSASNPLLKVAQHGSFFEGVRHTEFFKTAELDYLRTAYRGFQSELSKVAAFNASGLFGTATRAARSAGSKPISLADDVARLAKPKKMSLGSGPHARPSAPKGSGRMSRGDVEKSLSELKRRPAEAISASDAARFKKAPSRVGGGSGAGVWKIAGLASAVGAATRQGEVAKMLAGAAKKQKAVPWKPGKVLKGSFKGKPSTVNWGKFS